MFFDENGHPPSIRDFINNPLYPSFATYQYRFGSWNNALKMAGLDIDIIVGQGILDNNYQKGRLAEIVIRDHFNKNSVDLSGKNCHSPCDGICPNGKIYDVKSSKFYNERSRWDFGLRNKHRDKIDIYYLLAFNEDYMKLEHGWRIPGNMTIDMGDHLQIVIREGKFNIDNMAKYDITNVLVDVLRKYEII